MPVDLTDAERAVLRIAQADLPDSLTPYADMAAETGMTEAQVLALLTRLKKSGAIRRFGASIKHQKTGWTHNAMVAWKVDEADADRCGALAAGHERISHVYYRPGAGPAEDWPYALYTMVHGRNEAECLDVVENLAQAGPLKEYAVLRSLKELKKISMTYFV
ncbi:MAG: Lrp/AsnC family transcriptional regulator [Desulfovibrio sp.]|jgi:DNA-binding Lrp family transcriptional regulator|nr:Lrp/AsnC family transcriptional regulator [Desulfovibrio sp.]